MNRLKTTFRPLRYKNFRLFFPGLITSQVGIWIQNVAISWVVYSLTKSPFMMGGILFVNTLPLFLVMMMDFKDRKSDSVKSISILEGIKEGIEYAFHSPQITTLLAFAGVFSFIALTYPLLMPIYTKEVLHSGADILGWIMSSTGIGALCSSIFLASKTSLRGLKYIICCGATLLSCGFILMGLIHSTAGSCITMFFVGLGFTSAITSDSTLLQSILDDDKRGRIMSLYSICFLGATSISNLVAGSIAQILGISNTLIIFGAVLLFSTILFFIKFLHLEFKTRI